MATQLPPPIINETLPACYKNDQGIVEITIPFSMNRAVSWGSILGFSIKFKTIQNNTSLGTQIINLDNTIKTTQIITFALDTSILEEIKIGQFFKVQVAYKSVNDSTTGYYSTIGVMKYTTLPKIQIKDFDETSENNPFPFECRGEFIYGEDENESPYSYNFIVYDEAGNEKENSGWFLHNPDDLDSYFFKFIPSDNKLYRIQYTVKTINNLEVKSLYNCKSYNIDQLGINVSYPTDITLTVENIFDEGYIKLSLSNKSFEKAANIEICRSDTTSNFTEWRILDRFTTSSLNNYTFKDYTIEQGIRYKYAYRYYNNQDLHSKLLPENNVKVEVMADFEDSFLSDSNCQIRIRFNPKISSFKINKLESKIETIGSQFPFIFRNGTVGYREFPIAGLISYHMDQNKEFMSNLDIIFNDQLERKGNPDSNNFVNQNIETTDLINYNIKAERKFKLKLLEWLNNGEIKLFRSPTEGNYLVRLMNISLSPEDKVGRMLHNFSCTAYEVQNFNYNNLINLGFYNIQNNNVNQYIGGKPVPNI